MRNDISKLCAATSRSDAKRRKGPRDPLTTFVSQNDSQMCKQLNLSQCELYFEEYFTKDEVKSLQWVSDLTDIFTDSSLKSRFQSQSFFEFWRSLEDECNKQEDPQSFNTVRRLVFLLLCERGFSAVIVSKSKYIANLKISKNKFILLYQKLHQDTMS